MLKKLVLKSWSSRNIGKEDELVMFECVVFRIFLGVINSEE